MAEKHDLHVSKSTLATIDPAIWRTWLEYIRVTDEIIASNRRTKWGLLAMTGSLCLVLGLLIGYVAARHNWLVL